MNEGVTQPFSSAEALRFGWRTTQANLRPLLILSAFGGFLGLVGGALRDRGAGAGLLGIGIQVLQAGVALALIRLALRLHDGGSADFERPRELLEGFFPYVLTTALYGLVVACGTALLIVPGAIWAAQFAFAGFLAADARLDPLEAMRASSRLTRGVKWPLFVFGLTLAGVNLLGAMALGVGLLVTVPTTCLAAAFVFRRLQIRAAAPVQPPAPQPQGRAMDPHAVAS